MAQKVETRLIDDVDGSEASETLTFGVDGTTYEIDLSTDNAAKLRAALADFVAAARKVGGRTRAPQRPVPGGYDPKAVRAWASANKIDLPARGRIPGSVLEQYRNAGY